MKSLLSTSRSRCRPAPGRFSIQTGDPGRRAAGFWLCVLSLAVIQAGWRPARAAQPPIEVQTVRIGFGGANAFKIGAWTPVRVQLKAGGERVSGFMEVVVPDDDGIPTSYRQPIESGRE